MASAPQHSGHRSLSGVIGQGPRGTDATTGPAATPAASRAAPPRPMNMFDSTFEKVKCARALVATSVHFGTVGPLKLSGTLEACRLLSFEEQFGNEVMYRTECCAEYGECSEKEVMEHLGFGKRQSQGPIRERTRSQRLYSPANPRKPTKLASMTDTRFEKN